MRILLAALLLLSALPASVTPAWAANYGLVTLEGGNSTTCIINNEYAPALKMKLMDASAEIARYRGAFIEADEATVRNHLQDGTCGRFLGEQSMMDTLSSSLKAKGKKPLTDSLIIYGHDIKKALPPTTHPIADIQPPAETASKTEDFKQVEDAVSTATPAPVAQAPQAAPAPITEAPKDAEKPFVTPITPSAQPAMPQQVENIAQEDAKPLTLEDIFITLSAVLLAILVFAIVYAIFNRKP